MTKLKQATIAILGRLLPKRIKKSLFHLSYHLARPEFDYFAYHYNFAPNMELGFQQLADRGFLPRTIVDVGAFDGQWSQIIKHIWPNARLFMIEPNTEKQVHLSVLANALNGVLFREVLGDKDNREVRFNIMGSGSSVMPERSSVVRRVEARRLRTLDSLLDKIDSPGLLKVDAQGYELKILEGAQTLLPSFEAILLEVATIEINEGAPLLHEVVAFMKNRRFVTYDILQIHRRPLDGALNQVDILFVREDSFLISDKRHFA